MLNSNISAERLEANESKLIAWVQDVARDRKNIVGADVCDFDDPNDINVLANISDAQVANIVAFAVSQAIYLTIQDDKIK